MRVFVSILTAILCATPSVVSAAGFSIFEAGARALGMGGALTARADDPSAIFFNPAGIARLDNTQVYLGGSLIFASTDFSGADPSPGAGMDGKTGTMVFYPVNLHATHKFSNDIAVGIGLFNNFGLGQDWEYPATFPGRDITFKVQLVTWNLNPTIAWAPNEMFSVGAGVQILYLDVDINRYIVTTGSPGINVGGVNLNANDVSAGFNVGVQACPNDDVVLGASFRSAMNVKPDGDATFNQIFTGNPAIDGPVSAGFPTDQRVRATVDLPWFVSVGGAYEGVEDWTFEVDVNVFGWSTFSDLTFEFESLPTEVRVQDYKNVVSVRAGAAYKLNDRVELRGGYYFDPTPQPRKAMSPFLGDVDRHGVSLGAGYGAGKWWVDGFGLLLLTSSRSTNGESLDGLDGTYDPSASILGANVGFRF